MAGFELATPAPKAGALTGLRYAPIVKGFIPDSRCKGKQFFNYASAKCIDVIFFVNLHPYGNLYNNFNIQAQSLDCGKKGRFIVAVQARMANMDSHYRIIVSWHGRIPSILSSRTYGRIPCVSDGDDVGLLSLYAFPEARKAILPQSIYFGNESFTVNYFSYDMDCDSEPSPDPDHSETSTYSNIKSIADTGNDIEITLYANPYLPLYVPISAFKSPEEASYINSYIKEHI